MKAPSEHRQRLLAEIAAQRTAISECIEPWRIPLARVDRGLNLIRGIARHPMLLVGGLIGIALLRRARLVKTLQRALVAWQLVRALRNAGGTGTGRTWPPA